MFDLLEQSASGADTATVFPHLGQHWTYGGESTEPSVMARMVELVCGSWLSQKRVTQPTSVALLPFTNFRWCKCRGGFGI